MMELVLVLPLLVLVVSLLFFFGINLRRYQATAAMDRYEAWRRVAEADSPTGASAFNTMFLKDQADRIDWTATNVYPGDALDQWVDTTQTQSLDAGAYLDTLLDTFPVGQRVAMDTTHASSIPLWQRLAGTISHQHTRIGNEWKHRNAVTLDDDGQWTYAGSRVHPAQVIRDVFLVDLDSQLQPYDDAGNGLASVLRRFYLSYPGYYGPEVPLEWVDQP